MQENPSFIGREQKFSCERDTKSVLELQWECMHKIIKI